MNPIHLLALIEDFIRYCYLLLVVGPRISILIWRRAFNARKRGGNVNNVVEHRKLNEGKIPKIATEAIFTLVLRYI